MDCYQKPRNVDNPNECFFYHHSGVEELDSHHSESEWDLRHCINQYLGELDYSGKRALDVGTASGFLTFEMEKRGAEVVSFDTPSASEWDLVPHYQFQEKWDEHVQQLVLSLKRVQNAYWYLHRENNSSARLNLGDIYRLPAELGNFDIVVMGMVLGHLRDPFQAIYSASRLCRDKIVITNQAPEEKPRSFWKRKKKKAAPATAFFTPSAEDAVKVVWWGLSVECIERMLGTLGFRVIQKITSNPKCLSAGRTGTERCVTIVAERFAGQPIGVESVTDQGVRQEVMASAVS